MVNPIRFKLTIEHLWGLIALVGVFVFVNTHPIRPYDFWWHITIGREILNTRSIPTVDVYSSTANGQPYPSYSIYWLMDVYLFSLYKIGGLELVIFVHSLMITAAYFVVFWLSKQISHSWRIAAFGALFAAALGLNDWNVRPQGITFLLASLFLLAIYQYQKTNKWGWLVIFPAGMLVWANSHGTFVIGLVLIGIWLSQEIWNLIRTQFKREAKSSIRKLYAPGLTLGITTLVCFVNPRGFGTITYIQTLTGNPAVQNLVTEWASPSIHTLLGAIFYTGLVISATILALSPRRPSFSHILTFLILGILALRTSRGIVWFGLVMAPILAEHLATIVQKYKKTEQVNSNPSGSKIVNITFLIIIISVGIISLPWFKDVLPLPQAKAGLVSTETPVEATQVLLTAEPPGQLFNAISFGSYLIWSAFPQYQVFVDSRIELFPTKVWMDYLNISNANGDWEALLNDYGVNTLMLSPVEQPLLINAINNSGDWEEIYKDETAYIYKRK